MGPTGGTGATGSTGDHRFDWFNRAASDQRAKPGPPARQAIQEQPERPGQRDRLARPERSEPQAQPERLGTTGATGETGTTGSTGPTGPSGPTGPTGVAGFNQVKVSGPAKVKRKKKATYKVGISNSGNAAATGVRLKVSGRGLTFNTSVGVIEGGTTRTVKVKVKPKKPGKVKASFKVTSENAGGKTIRKTIKVKK